MPGGNDFIHRDFMGLSLEKKNSPSINKKTLNVHSIFVIVMINLTKLTAFKSLCKRLDYALRTKIKVLRPSSKELTV